MKKIEFTKLDSNAHYAYVGDAGIYAFENSITYDRGHPRRLAEETSTTEEEFLAFVERNYGTIMMEAAANWIEARRPKEELFEIASVIMKHDIDGELRICINEAKDIWYGFDFDDQRKLVDRINKKLKAHGEYDA